MKAIPCECGYTDQDFCPLHGKALEEILRAWREGGAAAADKVAALYAKDDES